MSSQLEQRSKIVSYIVDAGIEIEKLSAEIERLSDYAEYDVKAYRRVNQLKTARTIMQQDIRRLRMELQNL